MNIKTIERQARKLGLALKITQEDNETLYSLQDRDGNEIIGANSKRMLYNYLPYMAQYVHTPEAERLRHG
jgi:hypothetical protein